MPYRLCEQQLIDQPAEQPWYCDFRLCGNKRKNTLYEYSNNENILIYQKHQSVNQSVYN